jgi:hypothetical protein
MDENLESLVIMAYREWRGRENKEHDSHPDEETFVCFVEERLTPEESNQIKAHVLSCQRCSEILSTCIKMSSEKEIDLPSGLIDKTKNLLSRRLAPSILEIILRLKEKTLEIINTTGDVLVGQELVPAAVLRSRKINEFTDSVTILKDFKDIRLDVKIEKKRGDFFEVSLIAREKQTQKTIKDLRITLIKDEVELESYLSDSEKVVFEHVLLGKYTVEISTVNEKLATVLLDIKI